VSGYRATSGNTLTDTVGTVPVTLFEVDARTCVGGFTARARSPPCSSATRPRWMPPCATPRSPSSAPVPDPVSAQARGGYLEAGYDSCGWRPGQRADGNAVRRFDYVDTQADVPTGFTRIRRWAPHDLHHRPALSAVPGIGLKLDYRRTNSAPATATTSPRRHHLVF